MLWLTTCFCLVYAIVEGFPHYLVHRSPRSALWWAKSVRPILQCPSLFTYFVYYRPFTRNVCSGIFLCVFLLPACTAWSSLLCSWADLTKTIQRNKEGNLQDLAVFWCPVNTQHAPPTTTTSRKILSQVQVLWSAVRRWALLTYPVVWDWNFTCLLVTE